DGTAAAHACTRTTPPGDPAARRAWLTRQTYTWPDDGQCLHRSQTRSYRPPNRVGDLVRARNRTCTFPGCRRPATRCDLDHTTPWDKGGRTCPCNLGPVCRRHHQVKQTPGWTLTHPQPGVLTWTAPHGRSYTVTPSVYIS
ncbi:MAG TPA: HNH endonuclease signature motif containing protein, partial [Streptosporangiaceae bacterium]|nr:HNH endonuclease signature motif containing protein [Streptosporangiaceae bacterium]